MLESRADSKNSGEAPVAGRPLDCVKDTRMGGRLLLGKTLLGSGEMEGEAGKVRDTCSALSTFGSR